jgi:outer membrane receptor protein involved in Fe transport
MRSFSAALVDNPNYVSDSFDYRVMGLYVQDTWTPTEKFEAAIAFRVDKIEADFVDPNKPGTEINETLISPRLDLRYGHNDNWQSRFSIGQGYRAPLSFFESDHGILDAAKGYLVDVSKSERSLGTTYSINFTNEKYISTFSVAHTQVNNLASLDYNSEGIPVLTQLTDTAVVTALDWAFNVQLTEAFNLGLTAEMYNYNDVFKQSFGIAPIDKRAGISGLWQLGNWRIASNLDYVASRNLRDYGYEGFDKNDNTLAKPSTAPSYFLLDFKTNYQLNDSLTLYFGVTNLLDYNQAAHESSPLLFNQEGEYDVTYIYAPMRGRTAYFGFDFDY